MGILKALYLLPSGRLGTTGEIVADGGEVEMFSPTLESTSCCAWNSYSEGERTTKAFVQTSWKHIFFKQS